MDPDTDDRLEIEKQHETVYGDQASRYTQPLLPSCATASSARRMRRFLRV